jgi:hypothetical protein
LTALLLWSCTKAVRNRKKHAGLYEVEKYERYYYDHGRQVADTITENLGQLYLYDNHTAFHNLTDTTNLHLPASWHSNHIGTGLDVYWYPTLASDLTITFFSDDGTQSWFLTYTMQEKKHNRYTWTQVRGNPDHTLKYKEILTVKYLHKD